MWELRSVNGRGLDLRFRLPPGWDALEAALREAAGKALKRGNVTANLSVKREKEPRLVADPAALEQVVALAMELHRRIPGSPVPRAEALLGLPGVYAAGTGRGSGPIPSGRRGRLSRALGGAGGGTAGRGRAVGRDAHASAGRDRRLASSGRGRGSRSARGAARAGDGKSAALLREAPSLPEERIAQEVALLAARSDVREELDRLASQSKRRMRCCARRRTSAGGSTSWCRSSIARPTHCAASRPRSR